MADSSPNRYLDFFHVTKKFIWRDEIPDIGEYCDLFVNRIFDIDLNSEIVRFSISFTYDTPNIILEAKLMKGAEFIEFLQIVLKYESEGFEGKTWLKKVW